MTLFQKPNKTLIAMLGGFIVMLLAHGLLGAAGETLFIITGTIWSYLELTNGINRFRKILGGVVLALIAVIVLVSLYYA
jgi:hypothetical protein